MGLSVEQPGPSETRSLRVVHLLPCLYLGGAEQHVLRLTRSLAPHIQFSLVAPDGPGDVLFTPDGIPRRPFRRLETDFHTAFSSVRQALAAEAAAGPIDIVHVHIESGLLWFARKVLPDVPRIFTAHGIVGGAALKFWLTARAINWWADRACVVSAYERGRFERAGADPRKLRLIANGTDVPPHSAAGTRDMALRLGLDRERHIVVGTLARLESEKGLDLLVRAVARLGDRLPHLRLVIAGSGSQEAKLKRLADSLGCVEQIRFAGHVSEVGDLLSCLDIYTQPSRSEAFGLAVTEAMSMGLPAVVTSVGGLPEQIVDGDNGLIVPPNDAGALSEAIARIAEDTKLRGHMAKAARTRHARYFGMERLRGSMYEVYRESVRSAAKRPV